MTQPFVDLGLSQDQINQNYTYKQIQINANNISAVNDLIFSDPATEKLVITPQEVDFANSGDRITVTGNGILVDDNSTELVVSGQEIVVQNNSEKTVFISPNENGTTSVVNDSVQGVGIGHDIGLLLSDFSVNVGGNSDIDTSDQSISVGVTSDVINSDNANVLGGDSDIVSSDNSNLVGTGSNVNQGCPSSILVGNNTFIGNGGADVCTENVIIGNGCECSTNSSNCVFINPRDPAGVVDVIQDSVASICVGNLSDVISSDNSIQIGTSSDITNSNSVAKVGGNGDVVDSDICAVIGNNCDLNNADDSIAIGGDTNIDTSTPVINIGVNSSVTNSNNNINIGGGSTITNAPNNVKIGHNLNTTAGISNSIIISHRPFDNPGDSPVTGSIAFGAGPGVTASVLPKLQFLSTDLVDLTNVAGNATYNPADPAVAATHNGFLRLKYKGQNIKIPILADDDTPVP